MESWDAWGADDQSIKVMSGDTNSYANANQNTYRFGRRQEPEPEPELEVDYFQDMTPKVKSNPKVYQ